MRKRLAYMLAALLLLTCLPLAVQQTSEAATDYSWVRVKLSVANATSLSISLKGNYFINENGASFSGGTLSLRTNGDGTLTVAHSSLGDVYTGKSFSLMREHVERTAGYARMAVSGVVRNYLGHFNIRVTSSGYLQVVNVVPLAHYLYGVIRGEMGNTFPLEALKAQAVAAKCYAINNMSSGKEYDIGDTANDQVYKGYDPSESNVINAVDSTLDKVLTVNNNILCTYYSASNGGETKLVSQAWSNRGGDAGYGISLDEYDLANTLSPKETAFFPLNGGSMSSSLQSFLISKAAAVLGTGVASVDMIHSVAAYAPRYSNVTRDLTRATVTMTVTTGSNNSGFGPGFGTGFGPGFGTGFPGLDTGYDGSIASGGTGTIGGTQTTVTVDFALSELTSGGVFTNSSLRTYWGEAVPGGYNLYHVRYGHGVGLSQRGAQQRAKAGYNYQQILAFYYPGATLKSITVNPPQDPQKTVVEIPDAGTSNGGSQGQGYPAWGVTTGNVNFRKGPDVSYESMGKIATGTQVLIYGYASNWYYISCNGMLGYMSADYVSITGAADSGTVTDPATPTPEQTASQTGLPVQAIGTVTGSGVNFRSGPGTNYQSLGKLVKGTELLLYGQEGTWYHASASGVEGYISASYVKVTSTATVTPTPTPTSTPDTQTITYSIGIVTGSGVNLRDIPSTNGSAVLYKLAKNTQLILWNQSGDWYYAQYGNEYGYISAKYVKVTGTYNAEVAVTPSPDSGNTGTGGVATPVGTGETTGNVNFREGPSTSTKKIAQLKKGTKLILYALENGWYEVDAGGTHGYISAKYVKIVDESVGTQEPTAATGTTTGTVNFRKAASTSAPIIETLKKGTQVALLYESGDWYCASYNGTTGYLYRAYVKVVSAGSSGIPNGSAPTTSENGANTNVNTGSGTDNTIALGGVPAITNGKVYFRQSPTTSGVINRELPKDTALIVYNCLDDWCLVAVDGVLGYVHSSYVQYR